uniref:Uncharacterized protein n=1 Tax=Trichobilharzia regenti TaxID=157069 RepID=A0AA85J528_TRIRE|nr:unnamed protein product [Trichobilharzia regenti]
MTSPCAIRLFEMFCANTLHTRFREIMSSYFFIYIHKGNKLFSIFEEKLLLLTKTKCPASADKQQLISIALEVIIVAQVVNWCVETIDVSGEHHFSPRMTGTSN